MGRRPHFGVYDRMLIGGWKAIAADVYGWLKPFKRNSSRLSGPTWCPETYQRAILEKANVTIFRVKLAYATVSVDGQARYAEHLSNALDIYGPGLLRDYPAVCPCNASAPTSCAQGDASKRCIPHIQTAAMRSADPGFCKLARLCKCCAGPGSASAARNDTGHSRDSNKLRVRSSNTPLWVDRSAPRVRVLALVLSSDSIHARAIRQRIRASWMAALPATMRALFVIGGLTDGVARVNGSLVNGDELFLATDDSYAGLAAKVLDALAWAERHSDSFDYLLKVDDDTFVCPTMVVEWLQGQRRDRLYAGQPQYFYKGGDGKEFSIPIAKEGRWANKPHFRIFGSSNYARYMLGGGYVLSVDAVRNVVRNARARGLFGTTLRREGNMPTAEDALIGRLLESSAEHVIMPALAAVFGMSGEKHKLARPEKHCHQESSILFHPIDFSVVGPLPLGPPSRVLFEPG